MGQFPSWSHGVLHVPIRAQIGRLAKEYLFVPRVGHYLMYYNLPSFFDAQDHPYVTYIGFEPPYSVNNEENRVDGANLGVPVLAHLEFDIVIGFYAPDYLGTSYPYDPSKDRNTVRQLKLTEVTQGVFQWKEKLNVPDQVGFIDWRGLASDPSNVLSFQGAPTRYFAQRKGTVGHYFGSKIYDHGNETATSPTGYTILGCARYTDSLTGTRWLVAVLWNDLTTTTDHLAIKPDNGDKNETGIFDQATLDQAIIDYQNPNNPPDVQQEAAETIRTEVRKWKIFDSQLGLYEGSVGDFGNGIDRQDLLDIAPWIFNQSATIAKTSRIEFKAVTGNRERQDQQTFTITYGAVNIQDLGGGLEITTISPSAAYNRVAPPYTEDEIVTTCDVQVVGSGADPNPFTIRQYTRVDTRTLVNNIVPVAFDFKEDVEQVCQKIEVGVLHKTIVTVRKEYDPPFGLVEVLSAITTFDDEFSTTLQWGANTILLGQTTNTDVWTYDPSAGISERRKPASDIFAIRLLHHLDLRYDVAAWSEKETDYLQDSVTIDTAGEDGIGDGPNGERLLRTGSSREVYANQVMLNGTTHQQSTITGDTTTRFEWSDISLDWIEDQLGEPARVCTPSSTVANAINILLPSEILIGSWVPDGRGNYFISQVENFMYDEIEDPNNPGEFIRGTGFINRLVNASNSDVVTLDNVIDLQDSPPLAGLTQYEVLYPVFWVGT